MDDPRDPGPVPPPLLTETRMWAALGNTQSARHYLEMAHTAFDDAQASGEVIDQHTRKTVLHALADLEQLLGFLAPMIRSRLR